MVVSSGVRRYGMYLRDYSCFWEEMDGNPSSGPFLPALMTKFFPDPKLNREPSNFDICG